MIENKIINSLNLGYIRYPKNGKEPLFNSVLTRLLGYKNEQAIISSGILQKIYDYIISNIDLSEDNAQLLVLDSTLVRNNGDLIHVQYHISGTKGILELYVVDTTEHELLKRSLKESEDKTDSILNNLVDGIITMDTSEIIQSVNPAVEKMFKYSSKELIGKNVKILMPEPDKSLHKKYLQNYSRTQKTKIIGIGREVFGRKKDGTIFPIYLGVSEVDLSGQKIFIGIIRDITIQKNAQDRLLQTLEEVEERITRRTTELAEKNVQLSTEIVERERTEYIVEREAYIVRQNPGPVFRADYSGILLFANPAAKKLFGKNLVGKNLISVLEGITIEILKNVSRKKPIIFEEDIGDKFYLLTLVKDTSSKNLIVYGVDITSKKFAEEELKRSEIKFRQFFENEPEYCYMISPDGIILDVNKIALKALGYRKEELVGSSVLKIYPKDMHEKAKKSAVKWNKTGILPEMEFEIITKTGERRNVLLSANAVRDDKGNLLHSISIQKDITDRIKNQKERENLALDLGHRVKELSCLQQISNLIEEELELSELFLRIIKIVPNGLRYPEKAWANITFDDLDYNINQKNHNEDYVAGSDIGVSGKLRGILKIGYIDDTEILSEEVDMIYNISRRVGMLIERNELRENLLKQEKIEAIQNLAAAVAHEFNQPLQVLQLIASVANKDNIESDPKLLEQIPRQVAKISDLINKLLNVTKYETKVYTSEREIVDIHKAGGRKNGSGKRVLVVDDDVAILQLMIKIIKKSGYDVESAENAEEALKMIIENEFRLVISDISLPGMSGIDLFKEVGKKYGNPEFIFMSGYAVEDMEKSVFESAAGFFPKPFKITNVMNTISKILSN